VILIVSEPGDVHAQQVGEQLDVLGAAHRLLDLREFPCDGTVSMRFEPQASWSGSLHPARGSAIALHEVGAVWWRRPQGLQVATQLTDESYRLFALGETDEMFGGLWPSLDAFWVNDPKSDEVAHKKPYQLKLAQAVGLQLPRTLMTSCPDEARAFLDGLGPGRTVYKCFSATYQHWRETRLLTEEEARDLSAVRLCPVIFQEYVPASVDVRVTVVGDSVFAAAIHSREGDYPVDFRMNLDAIRITPHTLPQPVWLALRALLDRLGLFYGAADFRLTPEGRYVFLEVNPAGQWLFVEDATGQPIARTLAATLAHEARARAGCRDDRPRGRVKR
jgi:hypothetical protein